MTTACISPGGDSNIIGGDEEDERNLIAGNSNSGVQIAGGQINRVEGNDLGSATLPNDYGVRVESSFNFVERQHWCRATSWPASSSTATPVGPPPILNVVDGNDSQRQRGRAFSSRTRIATPSPATRSRPTWTRAS